jgi:hypothetical protein
VLLSDPRTAAFIDDNFVPVWESVRPVPKVTIDFGDGRVLKRTLKGNTVMYVCLPDGRVADLLPGVYTPDAFLTCARESLELVERLGRDERPEIAREWHRKKIGDMLARETAAVSVSKAVVEAPLLAAMGALPPPDAAPGALQTPFERLCGRLDDMSAHPRTASSLRPVVPGNTAGERGNDAVAADSAINVRFVRPAVHLLLAGENSLPTPDQCRDVVFKKLLHVPIDDPNLGLGDFAPPGTP